jgi:hypothetical protein
VNGYPAAAGGMHSRHERRIPNTGTARPAGAGPSAARARAGPHAAIPWARAGAAVAAESQPAADLTMTASVVLSVLG